MKSIIIPTLCAVTAFAPMLCGCSTARSHYETPPVATEQVRQDESSQDNSPITHETDDEIHEIKHKRGISGVRRRFDMRLDGTYTVEYIHAPSGIEKDESIDYDLTLNADNTFTLTAVANGVSAEHYGHWYVRRGEIMMFYDEPVDPTAHNIYTFDSLYGDILPEGKIMIYDNCHTIVLAKNTLARQY